MFHSFLSLFLFLRSFFTLVLVFQSSLSDRKSPQVSKTLLIILADIKNCFNPQISKSSSNPLTKTVVTIQAL